MVPTDITYTKTLIIVGGGVVVTGTSSWEFSGWESYSVTMIHSSVFVPSLWSRAVPNSQMHIHLVAEPLLWHITHAAALVDVGSQVWMTSNTLSPSMTFYCFPFATLLCGSPLIVPHSLLCRHLHRPLCSLLLLSTPAPFPSELNCQYL